MMDIAADGGFGVGRLLNMPALAVLCRERDLQASTTACALVSHFGEGEKACRKDTKSTTDVVPRETSTLSPSTRCSTTEDLEQVTQSDILASTYEVATEVLPWSEDLRLCASLQQAPANFGEVLSYWSLKDKCHIAVKKLPNSWMTSGPDEFSQLYAAASENPWNDAGITKLLGKSKFRHACHFVGIYRDESHTYLATELATEGDLHTWIRSTNLPPGLGRETSIMPMAADLFSAVRALHDLGIAHRDISCENVLLTRTAAGEQCLKIIDFGMASAERFCDASCSNIGKSSYRAPETHGSDVFDGFLADDFCVGVCLFLMTFSDYPWKKTKQGCRLFEFIELNGMMEFFKHRRQRNGTSFLIDIAPAALLETIRGLMELKPEERICLGETCYDGLRPDVWSIPWVAEDASEIRVLV
eukprot:TRINITY_DN106069_c0_g1_i1.p1 TRINITY_DN106069_c0_g1~~TRINITY_DN106069_c0_g1_i1.p1  ORF type:complete len:416 (+),score=75.35 TRINITY_DN106069_c0_g1_i1:88-1335(+)